MLLICLLFAVTVEQLRKGFPQAMGKAQELDQKLVDSLIADIHALDENYLNSVRTKLRSDADEALLEELFQKLGDHPNEDQLLTELHQTGLDPQIMSNYKHLLKTTDEEAQKQLDEASKSCRTTDFGWGYQYRFEDPQRYLDFSFWNSFHILLQGSNFYALKFYNCMLEKFDGEAALNFVKLEMQVLRLK